MVQGAGAASVNEFQCAPYIVKEQYPGAEDMLNDLYKKITSVAQVNCSSLHIATQHITSCCLPGSFLHFMRISNSPVFMNVRILDAC